MTHAHIPTLPPPRDAVRTKRQFCDYCGQPSNHHWTAHPEARADAAAWKAEEKAEEFPFGDHRGE